MPHDYPQHFYKSSKEKSVHRHNKKEDKKSNIIKKVLMRAMNKDVAKGKSFLDR